MVKNNKIVVIASHNKGKIREFKRLFSKTGWQFLSAAELGLPDIEETGRTFVENARIKALACAEHTKLPSLGEDSGLEVDKLEGAPGVKSHRFSIKGTDEDNNTLLLKHLDGVLWEERRCRYKSAVVLADGSGIVTEAVGSVEGIIDFEPRGFNGFGYDPLFYALELGKTFGEASDWEKDEVSHRRRAVEKLLLSLCK